jgi:N-acetylglucosaminyldiphosphoundecaprenol N-acetyl-beta-D-mannosaminyltransferase
MTPDLARRRLFGYDFVDAASIDDVIPAVLAMADPASCRDGSSGTVPVVVTPNVDHLVKLSRRRPSIPHELVSRAEIVLPDGQPIVWSSRLLGAPLRARLPGSTLVAALVPVLAERRVLVVAHSDELARRLEQHSTAFKPVVAPRLQADDSEGIAAFVRTVIDSAIEHRAEFIFLTIGHPKQELVIAGLLDRWPDARRLPVLLAIGQSFDMYFGMVRRAPEWMQRAGLEWFFRFVQEPRRLFRRYFVDDPAFLGIVLREWRSARRSSVRSQREA